MIRFRLFGFPVTIHWFFWVIVAVLGTGFRSPNTPQAGQALLVWVVVVFVSIMVHELGHALMYRRYGGSPSISLYSLGGVTSATGYFDRRQTFFITLAGPLCGLALGGIALVVGGQVAGDAPWLARVMIGYAIWVNIFWSIFNLLPVLPLDGGHLLDTILGPNRRKTTAVVGMVVAVLVCLWAVQARWIFVALLFGFMAYGNWQRSQGKKPVSF